MFYTGTAVRVSDDNCVDFIEVGASITAQTTSTNISLISGAAIIATAVTSIGLTATTTMSTAGASNTVTATGGDVGLAASAQVTVTTAATLRIAYSISGEWLVGGTAGVAGQVIASNGAGTPPTWQPVIGTVVEPITQVVYGTGVAVDSDSFFTYNVVNGVFTVNATAGASRPAAMISPGTVRIYGKDATNTGASVEIFGGDANVVGASSGGTVTVRGGQGGPGGVGGAAELIGGSESFINRGAGAVNIQGGAQTHGVADTGNRGGNVNIRGGDGGTGAFGGDVLIQGGNDGGISPAGNSVTIGFNAVDGIGTELRLQASPATTARLTGGVGVATSTKGQDIQIESGSAFAASGTADAGDLFLGTGIRGSHPAGTGEYGHVVVYGSSTPTTRPLGEANATTGDWVLAGSGGPAPSTANTALAAATTGGFTWLPRISGTPVGVPNGVNWGGGSYAPYSIPFVAQNNLAGSIILWAYDTVGGAWKSITLV
jgi:hypothetical protein